MVDIEQLGYMNFRLPLMDAEKDRMYSRAHQYVLWKNLAPALQLF